MQVAGKDVSTNDLGVMGAGVVVLIASFLPWYGVDYGFASVHINGWHGFFATVGILLALAAAGVVAVRVIAGMAAPAAGPVGPALLVLALAGAAALFVLVRLLDHHDYTKFGLYLALLAALAEAAFAFLAFRTSGEAVPTRSQFGGPGAPTP